MSKYKILWIDDRWEEMDSFKDRCELPENGMEVVACKYSKEGMKLFEKHLEEWSGVILDAKVLMSEDSQYDNLQGLTYSIQKIHELAHRREIPYYIFTGQPDTASGTAFAEEHYGHYYEKDQDEDKLIEDIKRNADMLVETQLVHKYQKVFDTWPEARHDLLRILKVLEDEEWTNNSVLNDIRKILSDFFSRCYERGFCTVKHDGSNLSDCSRMMGQRYMSDNNLVPVYVQRALHSCVDITNPGSHRTVVDSDVAKGNAPYLLRSLIYEMLTILHWAKCLPGKENKNLVLSAISMAKQKYESDKERK